MTNPESSASFTLAAVFFEQLASADACDEAIGQLKTSQRLPERFEFRFSVISDRQKRVFFEAIASFEFLYVTSTLHKRRLPADESWKDKGHFYKEACRRLVEPLGELIRISHACANAPSPDKVLFDNNDDPVYIQAMKDQLKLLKTDDGRPLVKKARPQNSQSSNLLQLADMACGAIVHEQNHGSNEYRKLIRQREGTIIIWP